MSDPRAAAVLAAVHKATATRLVGPESREDCIKVLTLRRDYAAVLALREVTDDDYAAIVASVRGPATGPKTPQGFVLDLDGPPPRRPS